MLRLIWQQTKRRNPKAYRKFESLGRRFFTLEAIGSKQQGFS
jgi:hypothetical protein